LQEALVDVRLIIKQRLEELGLEQRDLAAAARVTESYISQLLTRKKAPPDVGRTGLYERMNSFLKLPKGRLSAIAAAQRREELKQKLTAQPSALFKEVRQLVMRKCKAEKQSAVRDVFEKQPFGELEQLVTQKLLEVTKKIARAESKNEAWLSAAAKHQNCSSEKMRAAIPEFLATDLFNIYRDHCRAFLDPMIESWDIDLKTLSMEIVLNRRLAPIEFVKFQFAEVRSDPPKEEPGLRAFLRHPAISADITESETQILRSLQFGDVRPNELFYYRTLQNLRDPLHFLGMISTPIKLLRNSGKADRQMQLDSRKNAIHRWAKNSPVPAKR
jgi:transcriptional regulator with XRE-family HTH domain